MNQVGPISKVRGCLSQVVNWIHKTRKRFVITRQGKAVVVMLSPEELETLEVLADPKLIKSLIHAEADIKAGRLYSHRAVWGKQ